MPWQPPGDSCLVPIFLEFKDSNHRQFWRFRCSCGNEKILNKSLVASGNTRSCGCIRGKSRVLSDDQATINQIILQYKRHARDRQIDWHLERHEAEMLFRSPCYYCGDPHGNLKKTKNNKDGLLYNGIDRINSSMDYSIDNVVACCGTCNIAKGRRSKEEFLTWVNRIYNNMAEQWG